jgi:hypothetical protein
VQDKIAALGGKWPSIGIVTAYNDMLSAHAPYERFPDIIRKAARERGAVAQVAGGVPAMCDGVTQGFEGMELSLFSRDVIALSTAVSLSHATFDAALLLGICDKIVPGLLIGALRFPWLPAIFVPGGPMPPACRTKKRRRAGSCSRKARLGARNCCKRRRSYHAPGTCTFYGTANSNQMMMELMGLHLPNAAFVNPNTPLRDALTIAATHRAAEITGLGDDYRPIGRVVDEKRDRERHRRADGDGRVDQSLHSSARHRCSRPASKCCGMISATFAGDAAARADLSKRRRGREQFPRCGRHGVCHARAAWARACCTATFSPCHARASPGIVRKIPRLKIRRLSGAKRRERAAMRTSCAAR